MAFWMKILDKPQLCQCDCWKYDVFFGLDQNITKKKLLCHKTKPPPIRYNSIFKYASWYITYDNLWVLDIKNIFQIQTLIYVNCMQKASYFVLADTFPTLSFLIYIATKLAYSLWESVSEKQTVDLISICDQKIARIQIALSHIKKTSEEMSLHALSKIKAQEISGNFKQSHFQLFLQKYY